MSEGIAVQDTRKRAARSCQHRWVIETPHGATSHGFCKRCGVSKRFPNAAEDALADMAKGGLGRWASRKPARPGAKNAQPT